MSPDGTLLTALLPSPLEPGAYLVQVSRGPATTQNASFVVVVGGGAKGPKGDPGEPGQWVRKEPTARLAQKVRKGRLV